MMMLLYICVQIIMSLLVVSQATGYRNHELSGVYQYGETMPVSVPPADVTNAIVGNVFPSPACTQFDDLGRNVDEAIDGLLQVLKRFNVRINENDEQLMRDNGCEGPVNVKARMRGKSVDAYYFPAYRNTEQFPTTVVATCGNRAKTFGFGEVFVGLALSGPLGNLLAGSQFYYGYEEWRNERETIGVQFETGSQPIANVEPADMPRQQGLEFYVKLDSGEAGKKVGGGIYEKEADGWVYSQRYVATFDN